MKCYRKRLTVFQAEYIVKKSLIVTETTLHSEPKLPKLFGLNSGETNFDNGRNWAKLFLSLLN